jgi:hypothetical protein
MLSKRYLHIRPESAKVDDDADNDDDDRSYSMCDDGGGEESDIEDFFSCHDENSIEHMEEDHVDHEDHEDHEDDAGSVHGDGKHDNDFGADSVRVATTELVEEMMRILGEHSQVSTMVPSVSMPLLYRYGIHTAYLHH